MCFSWEWLKSILILVVVIMAVIGMLQILVPWIIARLNITLGDGWNVVVRCFRILIWAAVAILVIIAVFMMIECLWSFVGGVSLLPHR
jgi:hypothetical protein